MALKRDRSLGGGKPRLALLFNATMAEYSYIESASPGDKIFDVGSGQSWKDDQSDGLNYGEWLLVPQTDFVAEVKMWGAGGGAHGSTSNAGGGGGGFAKADIEFYKGMPYTIVVPETGYYNHHNGDANMCRHSGRFQGGWPNGGGAGHNGGTGGGSAGIFFDASPTLGGPGAMADHAATTFQGAGQATAILMAGGGGGMGHHGNSSHGQGGGGGGLAAGVGHAQGQATQVWGGHVWATGSQGTSGIPFQGGVGGPSSYTGGGGGGWWGGTGGTHHSTHHNGGGGGTGHALDQSDGRHPNEWIRTRYPDIVKNSYLEASPVSHSSYGATPAATGDVDYNSKGSHEGWGGGHSTTYTPSTNRGNNGRVLIRLKK